MPLIFFDWRPLFSQIVEELFKLIPGKEPVPAELDGGQPGEEGGQLLQPGTGHTDPVHIKTPETAKMYF